MSKPLSEHRKEYKRAWWRSHPESVKATFQRWRAKNPERCRELQRQSYHKNKHKHIERRKLAAHLRYLRNKEKILAQTGKYAKEHRDIRRSIHRRWAERHPDQYRAINKAFNSMRAAIVRGVTVLSKQANDVIRRWKMEPSFVCEYCKREFPTSKMTVDHIIPISRHGTHTPENICRACGSCNSKKRDKMGKIPTWCWPETFPNG